VLVLVLVLVLDALILFLLCCPISDS
jgi:hypothetical protein